MPYGRCVIYMFPGDAEEIIGKARTGILPIFKSQPGFVAFGVMVRGSQLISMSAWRSERDAKAADELMRLRLGPPRWWSGWWVTSRLGESRLAGLR